MQCGPGAAAYFQALNLPELLSVNLRRSAGDVLCTADLYIETGDLFERKCQQTDFGKTHEGFYYDITFGERQTRIKTIAGFFPLVSGVADEKQGKRLIEWLEDKEAFNRPHRIPVLAADEEGYDPRGGYWRGSVWAPTNALVLRGLENHGDLFCLIIIDFRIKGNDFAL